MHVENQFILDVALPLDQKQMGLDEMKLSYKLAKF